MRVSAEVIKEMNLKEISDYIKTLGISKQTQREEIGCNEFTFNNLMRKEKQEEPRAKAIATMLKNRYSELLGIDEIEANEAERAKIDEMKKLKSENEIMIATLLNVLTEEQESDEDLKKIENLLDKKLAPIYILLGKHLGASEKVDYGKYKKSTHLVASI